MSVVRACRLENEVDEELELIAKKQKRSISFLINEAVSDYLFDQKEADIALARKNDKNDKLISTKEMLALLNNQNV